MSKATYFSRILFVLGLAFAVFAPGLDASAATLDNIRERGKFLAGVRFDAPPYGYVDEAGKNAGFDIDIARELAKRLGVKMEFVQVTGKTRIPMLQSGKVDALIAATTHTRKRDAVIDFSISYLTDGQKIMVRKGSGIHGVEDLTDKTIATVQGTTIEERIRELAPDSRILVFQEWPQAFLAFKQGLADALTSSVFILGKFAATDPDFEIVGPFLSTEPIAVGVVENDSKWRDAINFALQDMVKDGSFQKIFIKWFGKGTEYNLPMQTPILWP